MTKTIENHKERILEIIKLAYKNTQYIVENTLESSQKKIKNNRYNQCDTKYNFVYEFFIQI